MAKEEISAHKCATTFEALEGPLFGIYKGRLSVQNAQQACNRRDRDRMAVCPNKGGLGGIEDLRDRSCRLRCSLRLKARLQNWHLYFFSGAEVFFAGELLVAAGTVGAMSTECAERCRRSSSQYVDGDEENELAMSRAVRSHRVWRRFNDGEDSG